MNIQNLCFSSEFTLIQVRQFKFNPLSCQITVMKLHQILRIMPASEQHKRSSIVELILLPNELPTVLWNQLPVQWMNYFEWGWITYSDNELLTVTMNDLQWQWMTYSGDELLTVGMNYLQWQWITYSDNELLTVGMNYLQWGWITYSDDECEEQECESDPDFCVGEGSIVTLELKKWMVKVQFRQKSIIKASFYLIFFSLLLQFSDRSTDFFVLSLIIIFIQNSYM